MLFSLLETSTAAEQNPQVLLVLGPGAQVQFCAPRAESTDRREASLAELLACCEARLLAMGPLRAAVLALVWPVRFLPCCFLGLAWSVWVLV